MVKISDVCHEHGFTLVSFTAVGWTKLFLSNSKNDVHPAPGERNDGMGVPVLHSKAKSNIELGTCNLLIKIGKYPNKE